MDFPLWQFNCFNIDAMIQLYNNARTLSLTWSTIKWQCHEFNGWNGNRKSKWNIVKENLRQNGTIVNINMNKLLAWCNADTNHDYFVVFFSVVLFTVYGYIISLQMHCSFIHIPCSMFEIPSSNLFLPCTCSNAPLFSKVPIELVYKDIYINKWVESTEYIHFRHNFSSFIYLLYSFNI